MLIPLPLPGELSRGHIGRIRVLNSAPDYNWTTEILRSLVSDMELGSRDGRTVYSLANLCDMPLYVYMQQHSLLPYSAFYQSPLAQTIGQRWAPMEIGIGGLRPNNVSRYCTQCVEDDMARYGFSYWRRHHQLPGMLWCLDHEHALFEVVSSMTFHNLPGQSYARASTLRPLRSMPAGVRRFLTISELLLQQQKPIALLSFKSRLVHLAKARNFKYSVRSTRYHLSDEAIKVFPLDWLFIVFPRLHKKKANEFFAGIDAATRPAAPGAESSTPSFVMALSILFDDPKEAIDWLFDGSRDFIDVPN